MAEGKKVDGRWHGTSSCDNEKQQKIGRIWMLGISVENYFPS